MEPRTAVVIDDEPDMIKYLSSILEDNGFTVRSADNAKTGETLILEQRPDLILLDLMMPGRGGVQAFARLRGNEQTKDIPLIMVTGIKQEMGVDWDEVVDRFKARRPDGFVEKPVEPETLMKVINEVLSGTTEAVSKV